MKYFVKNTGKYQRHVGFIVEFCQIYNTLLCEVSFQLVGTFKSLNSVKKFSDLIQCQKGDIENPPVKTETFQNPTM